jgi:hypothetical protein
MMLLLCIFFQFILRIARSSVVPDLSIHFPPTNIPVSTPSNINGNPLRLQATGGVLSNKVGPDQATTNAIDTEAGGYIKVILSSNSAEPGCTYSQDPCVCLLRCPTGQTRYGDGSACRGGGLPNCDLGYCHNNPNAYSPCVISSGEIPLSSEWTVDLWVRPSSSSSTNGYKTIFGRSQTLPSLSIDNSIGKLGLNVQTAEGTCTAGFHPFTPAITSSSLSNVWSRLTIVQSTTKLYGYINGIKIGEINCKLSANYGISVIGNDHTDSQKFGSLSQVQLYQKALTDSQVTALFTGGTGLCPGETDPIDRQLSNNRLTKFSISGESGPEPGCTYSSDPCVCLLRCPAGQTRYGDGSACTGGGLPNCDLGVSTFLFSFFYFFIFR